MRYLQSINDLKAVKRKLFPLDQTDTSISSNVIKENDKENESQMLQKKLCKNDDQYKKLIRITSYANEEQKKQNKNNVTSTKTTSANLLTSTVANSSIEKHIQAFEEQSMQHILPPESITTKNYSEGQKQLELLTDEDIENIVSASTLFQSPGLSQITTLLQDNLQSELEVDFEEYGHSDPDSSHCVSNVLNSVHSILYDHDEHHNNQDTGLRDAEDMNSTDDVQTQIKESIEIRDVEDENEVENVGIQVNGNIELNVEESNREAEYRTENENRKLQDAESRNDSVNMHIADKWSNGVMQANENVHAEERDVEDVNEIEHVQNLIPINENRMLQADENKNSEDDFILFRRKQRKPGTVVKRLQKKQNRLFGAAYETEKEKIAAARSMKARCEHKAVKSQCSFFCSKVSDNIRENYFKQFWLLPTWDAKKAFLTGLCTTRIEAIRRRKSTSAENKKPKKLFHDCFLLCDDGTMVKVCCKLFTNTFGITSRLLLRWMCNKTDVLCDKPAKQYTPKQESIVEWVENLPKVPSHYCRATTSRMYVESTFRSISHMYSIYAEYAKNRGEIPLCRQLFANILEDKKVSIHVPRKDQCDLCCSHKAGNVSQDNYEEHIIKKDEARIAKNAAKEKCDSNTVVITMDVQSVLLAPKLMASAIYYKRKLQLHNMTFYRLNDGETHLYVWDESEGGVSSNEFTSCVVHYISALPENVKHVIIISDGCAYQNRNKVLSSALRDVSRSQGRVIEQLILERGHTMMEVDSVHAQLDRLFKNAVIYAPSDYVFIMRQARPQQPFNVKILDHTFFFNYDSMATNVTSIRPGLRAGEATVTDIRALR
jgi:hypothetical protein